MAKEMRKIRTGRVVRTKTDKTAVVETAWRQRHPLYRKQVRRLGRFNVHDALNQCRLGDLVRIQEVRPISKTKRWRLLEILERREVADVRPIDLEADAQVLVAEETEGGWAALGATVDESELDANEQSTDPLVELEEELETEKSGNAESDDGPDGLEGEDKRQ